MIQAGTSRYVWAATLLAATLAGAVFPVAGVLSYLVLALVPGAAIYLAVARQRTRLELALSALVVSPVITTSVTILLMLLGIPRVVIAVSLPAASGLFGAAVLLFHRGDAIPRDLNRSHTLILIGTVLFISLAVAYLPMSSEWWRTRADAVFHSAVIAQIRDFGIPPEDPYFTGVALQYMWFYHVHVLLMSEASHFSRYVVMALVNMQALWTLALSTFMLSNVLRRSFARGYAAVLTVLCGVNALFWLFLPVKLLAAFTGEVRGAEEIARSFTLKPYDMFTIGRFVSLGINMEFLLDKFIVATATSVGLGLMGAAWYACADYLRREQRGTLVIAFFASMGMIVFHSAIGVLSYGALAGGLVLLLLMRSRLPSYRLRPTVVLAVTLMAALIVTLPFLYSVTHAKRSDQLLPFGLSVTKMAGIFVTCALGVFLSAFQARRLFRTRESASWYFVLATACIVVICTLIRLPGTNTVNKLPLLVFFPLAVVGGWTFVDWAAKAGSAKKQRALLLVLLFAALAPLNALELGAYYNTTPDPQRSNPFAAMNPQEEVIAKWVGDNTPRDALFVDSGDRVFLVANGPRRYYMGNSIYAEGWGYDHAEMAKRQGVIHNLYSTDALSSATLGILGSLPAEVFVIARDETQSAKFTEQPSLFRQVFRSGGIAVFEVDREAARRESTQVGEKDE